MSIARYIMKVLFSSPSTQRRPPIRSSFTTSTHIKAPCSVLVIDASGSMDDCDWPPSRLDAAKEAAHAFLEEVRTSQTNAYMAVIAYGDRASILCDLTSISLHRIISDAINSIYIMGATNITEGLINAYELLRNASGYKKVILLSDGYHNVSMGPRQIADQLKRQATIECVGIGGSPRSVDERLLRYIASKRRDGTKRYRWIGDKVQLVKHFRELGRLSRE